MCVPFPSGSREKAICICYKQSLEDSAIAEVHVKFWLDRASTELPDLAWKIVEKLTFQNIGQILSISQQNISMSECRISISMSECRISISMSECRISISMSECRISISMSECTISILEHVECHLLSAKFWLVYLEQFLSAKFAYSEWRISIFYQKNIIFWAQNVHFLSAEYAFSECGILDGLYRKIPENLVQIC